MKANQMYEGDKYVWRNVYDGGADMFIRMNKRTKKLEIINLKTKTIKTKWRGGKEERHTIRDLEKKLEAWNDEMNEDNIGL